MSAVGNDRGAILLFTLGVMVALLLIGAASSLFTRSERRLSANVRDSTEAFYLAEAGVEWAHARLRGADPTLYFDSAATLSGSPVAFGGGSYEVSVGARDASGRRVVTSAGVAGGIERSVTVGFRRFGLDPAGTIDCFGPGDADGDGTCDGRPGILSNADITLPAGSRLDSYDGDAGGYVAGADSPYGSVATNGTLTLAGTSTVLRGDVFVGHGFDPGLSAHEGAVHRRPPFFLPPLPDHASVCTGITNKVLVDCDSLYPAPETVIAGAPPEETLTVGPGQTICMPAGDYCFRRIHVKSGGVLRIVDDPGTGVSSVRTTLRLGTPLDGGSALIVRGRLEYGTDMRPNLLRVFSHGDIDVSGWSGGRLFALFYAPRSSILLNTNGVGTALDVFGLAAADQVAFGSGPVRFHVDEDGRYGDFCADDTDPTCKPALVVRERWSEDRG